MGGGHPRVSACSGCIALTEAGNTREEAAAGTPTAVGILGQADFSPPLAGHGMA
jgi:hypothetical protein